jgi:hypothetical protein
MRSRTLFAIVFTTTFFVLPLAAHAGIPFFGPIIPTAYNVCPASFGLLITVINNIISLLITLAIVFVAPLMIAYAGFLFVVNPVNAAGKEKAKGILLNTVVGIVISLSGWLIVDAIMAVLYNPKTVGQTWSSLITSGGVAECLPQKGAQPGDSLNQATTGVSATGALSSPPSGKAGTACDPALVLAAAPALTATQANILACIAQPESQCGTAQDPPNFAWNTGTPSKKASTAAGPFQVLLSSNHDCYENSACYTAAVVSGPLNCQNGFDSFGNPKTDAQSKLLVDTCLKAAYNLNCSATAAACLLKNNGGSFSPWQADVKSQTQSGCINSGG